jgi:hypothetical protein
VAAGLVAGDFVKLELVLVRGSLSLLFNRRAFVVDEGAVQKLDPGGGLGSG